MNIRIDNSISGFVTSGKGAEKIRTKLNYLNTLVKVEVDGKPIESFVEASDESGKVVFYKTPDEQLSDVKSILQGDVRISIIQGKATLYESSVEKFPKFNLILQPIGAFMQVRLIDDRVVKTTESGLILQEKQLERTRIAEVLSVGPGQHNPINGGFFELIAKPGDLIYINAHSTTNAEVKHLDMFKDEPVSYLINENDVYGIYMPYDKAVETGLVEKRG